MAYSISDAFFNDCNFLRRVGESKSVGDNIYFDTVGLRIYLFIDMLRLWGFISLSYSGGCCILIVIFIIVNILGFIMQFRVLDILENYHFRTGYSFTLLLFYCMHVMSLKNRSSENSMKLRPISFILSKFITTFFLNFYFSFFSFFSFILLPLPSSI